MSPKNKQEKFFHLTYEIRYTPWFGPTAKAKRALEKLEVTPCSELEFLGFLKEFHPKSFHTLTFVQFYNFPGKGGRQLARQQNYHIAVLYLGPDPESRQILFEKREEITLTTGWYPLVMGTRATPAFSRNLLTRHVDVDAKQLQHLQTGKLQRIRSVAEFENGSSSGNAFVLEGELGSFLFDTGFKLNRNLPANLKAVALTHFHLDHAGGIDSVLSHNIPLLLTEPTLRHLYERLKKDPKGRKDLLQNALVIERVENVIQNNHTLAVFPVFHAPGSIGFSVRDEYGTTVIYPGDLCLKNGFLDYSPQILQLVMKHRTENTWVMLDAASVSQENEAIEEEDTPQNLLKEIFLDLNRRDVIFTSKNVETLVYEYILAFLESRDLKINNLPVKLVVSPALFRLCQTIFGPMIFRRISFMDPFLKKVVGESASNFVESHRLYPLDSLSLIPKEEHVIIFAIPGDIDHNTEIQARLKGSNVVLAGTVATREDELPTTLVDARPRTILRVSSSDWNFHSHEIDLANFVTALIREKIHVVFFHASHKKIDSFIRRHRIEKEFIHNIDDKGIRVN